MRKSCLCVLTVAVVLAGCLVGCAGAAGAPDYGSAADWAFWPEDGEDEAVDVFFVCPTVYFGTEGSYNMPLTDEKLKADFVGAINMEKGIYDADARFFAPYYRQAGLNVYTLPPTEREQYLAKAYEDVRDAFEYYLQNENDGRPIILAGFSQGADMSLRLMKEFFADDALQDQLVACYAIGWGITEEEMQEYPHLRFAEGEDDTGVILSFNSEAEEISDSLIVPEGTRTLAINPLSWKTGTDKADKSLNKGACFMNTDGSVASEVEAFTGAYIDPGRGTLKVPDVNEADYPPQLEIFEDGVYHVYDYQFFYRNLQDNVEKRKEAFLETAQQLAEAA